VLKDISFEVFEIILDFIYKDKISFESSKAREIFVAAGKLKIEGLKSKSAEILIKEMNEHQNLDYLIETFNLGSKFNSHELKLKAFEEIKKHFEGNSPGSIFDRELINDPKSLNILVNAKIKFDEEKRLIDEKMKNLQKQFEKTFDFK
jgi:hypothetical protein